MIYPDRKTFQRLAQEYNLIPVARTLMADTETPIRVFQHYCEDQYAFLLESVEGGVNWARYSFIGTDPFLVVRGKEGRLEVERQGGGVETSTEDPIRFLRQLLSRYRSPQLEGFPRFMGGAVGFFGYDLLRYYERKLPPHKVDDLRMNDVQFMFCDQLIVFDHFKQSMMIVANAHIPQGSSESEQEDAYREACEKIEKTVARLQGGAAIHSNTFSPRSPAGTAVDVVDYKSNVTKEQFISNVNRAKEYIRAGDIFQVVLSQRFEMETTVSPIHVYRVLRTINPSPYMYYLKMGEERIVGTSPELLVRVEGDRVQTRPIAGTRPRGKTPAEDAALEQELLADEKERAEHLMLVDLGRNDIGRVSVPGSVKVDTFMEIERYSHVMHIVSNVSGKLREDKDFYDAFLSCLPAGTVSGAPKLRAMEIIAELENESRGAYAGAIGYLGFSGNLDTCITIRTIIFREGKAYVQAGAGIVWDSIPEKEYEETVNKAKGMLSAIRKAEAVFGDTTSGAVEVNQDYH